MMDENVRNAFLLINHKAWRTPGGQSQARVVMQNATKKDDLWADVQFTFHDANVNPAHYDANVNPAQNQIINLGSEPLLGAAQGTHDPVFAPPLPILVTRELRPLDPKGKTVTDQNLIGPGNAEPAAEVP